MFIHRPIAVDSLEMMSFLVISVKMVHVRRDEDYVVHFFVAVSSDVYDRKCCFVFVS